ncbi:AAA family ATPase [Maioricimonas rarisocia]|nr:AAA family ATPase [Maioricimonas rarisocia]
MIETVKISGFKAVRSVTLPLERLTVIFGPNASGKTTLLEAISLLCRSATWNPGELFSGERAPSRICSRDAREARLALQLSTGTAYECLVSPDPDHQMNFVPLPPDGNGHSTPAVEPAWGCSRFINAHDNANKACRWEDVPGLMQQEVERSIQSQFLRLEPDRLAATSYIAGERARLRADGYGLASVLSQLKLNNATAFSKIEETLRSVIPSVLGLRFVRDRVVRREIEYHEQAGQRVAVESAPREYWGDALRFDSLSGRNLPASAMSEGTLLILGLLTAAHSSSEVRILLLDDLDRALHPRAQSDVVRMLTELQKSRRDLQIVATSHSPYLVDALDYSQVRMTTIDNSGEISCASMESHPDAARWRDEMAAGEFWSHTGEKWVETHAN